jgi:RHS repeat-associated protein
MLLKQIQDSGTRGTAYYYHADRLGSVRALTNQAGAVVATYAYDAYGNTTASTGSIANPFRYAGEYQDAETGLYYLRARYYDPASQQFLTRDPLVAVTEQAYNYAGGSPLNATDPSGEVPCPGGYCWEPVRKQACYWFGWFCTNDERAAREQAEAEEAIQEAYDGCAYADLGCNEWASWLSHGICSVAPGQSPYAVARPQNISDSKLKNIIGAIYKAEGKPGQTGTGSTADAIRNELLTGQPTKGVFHAIHAGPERIRSLQKWLADNINNPNAASTDIAAAQAVLQDLLAAMAGR